jgi:hypothetical protein
VTHKGAVLAGLGKWRMSGHQQQHGMSRCHQPSPPSRVSECRPRFQHEYAGAPTGTRSCPGGHTPPTQSLTWRWRISSSTASIRSRPAPTGTATATATTVLLLDVSEAGWTTNAGGRGGMPGGCGGAGGGGGAGGVIPRVALYTVTSLWLPSVPLELLYRLARWRWPSCTMMSPVEAGPSASKRWTADMKAALA